LDNRDASDYGQAPYSTYEDHGKGHKEHIDPRDSSHSPPASNNIILTTPREYRVRDTQFSLGSYQSQDRQTYPFAFHNQDQFTHCLNGFESHEQTVN
jgi:hypothetical protein